MGIKELLLVITLAGCGEVLKAGHDAAPSDAAADTAIDGSPVCSAPMMMCGAACIDVMTDEQHCGSCTKQCQSTEGCAAGSCIDATASCVNIQMLDPNAASGPYTHSADRTTFFCDMTKTPAVQYDGLAMGRFNGTYSGYSIIDATQLQDAAIQAAFIYWFNRQGGFPALETFSPGNVCTTISTGVRLAFGNSLLFPYANGNTPTAYTANSIYTEDLVSKNPAVIMAAPLDPQFFTMNPPSTITNQCSDVMNPALFFKKH
jgi:hypothetical protein